ncbi:hypothetical protein MKQ70_04370 [Chitinophaga sedimenti]|uniref:hypothetical protein n=1 Tax=Chitinophaga sedimenti TaxID=2033606 RepID=UPI002003C30F|nr:hypothetical protein [Chitinophaga sedimenti]MCK7554285.1 hypothetical protein [Chitinophaga sedimenti]
MKYLLWLLLSGGIIQTSNEHMLFEQLQQRMPGNICSDTKVHDNDKQAKGRITFLNRDFRTAYFAAATSVRFFECEDRRLHLAMISLEFKNEQDMDLAMAAITASRRTAFRLPNKTRFAPKKLGNELVIIYSQTFTDQRFQDFVNRN